MTKMTKDEARAELKEAKKMYHNRVISFDRYVAIKKQSKKVLLEKGA